MNMFILFCLFCLVGALRAEGAGLAKKPHQVSHDSSQVNLRTPSRHSLARFATDKDFVYDREPPAPITWWEKIKHWFWRYVTRVVFSKTLAPFWRIFFYAAFAASLIFVITRLLQSDIRGILYKAGEQAAGDFRELAENLHEMDLDGLIAAAVQQKQYRVAIRLHYLKLLKQLADKGLIEWKIDKTNRDYINELRKDELRAPFARITSLFEYIWYGEFPVDETTFQRTIDSFQNIGFQLAEA
jgi:hypothetical protein